MKLKWFGHSCFLITSKNGIKIVTDPFDETVGYKIPKTEANIISTSHDHYDHNNTGIFDGAPVLIKGSGKISIHGIEITGVDTFHDEDNGKKRGLNTVFKFLVDGINVCHLGDLGHILNSTQIEELGKVDVLLMPVGGIYTIDHAGAMEVMDILKPTITIPMHYKTKALKFSLAGVDKFLSLVGEHKNIAGCEIDFDNPTIDLSGVVVLDYK